MMKILKITLGFIISIACVNVSATVDQESNQYLNERCEKDYEQIKNVLQFLYKLDGNLQLPNSSKIKRIEFLRDNFSDFNKDMSERRKYYYELYQDPDWWIFELKSSAKEIIDELELLNNKKSWAVYKEYVMKKPVGSWQSTSATTLILDMVATSEKMHKFFKTLAEVENNLERLNAGDKLNRALSDNMFERGMQKAFFPNLPSDLLECQVRMLDSHLSKTLKNR